MAKDRSGIGTWGGIVLSSANVFLGWLENLPARFTRRLHSLGILVRMAVFANLVWHISVLFSIVTRLERESTKLKVEYHGNG